MSRYNPAQNSFVAGELSPRLQSRDELDQYHQGCRQLRNMVVTPHGGVTRRPGTAFVCGALTDAPGESRLVPFTPAEGTSFVLELAANTIRVYTAEGLQLADPNCTEDEGDES